MTPKQDLHFSYTMWDLNFFLNETKVSNFQMLLSSLVILHEHKTDVFQQTYEN